MAFVVFIAVVSSLVLWAAASKDPSGEPRQEQAPPPEPKREPAPPKPASDGAWGFYAFVVAGLLAALGVMWLVASWIGACLGWPTLAVFVILLLLNGNRSNDAKKP